MKSVFFKVFLLALFNLAMGKAEAQLKLNELCEVRGTKGLAPEKNPIQYYQLQDSKRFDSSSASFRYLLFLQRSDDQKAALFIPTYNLRCSSQGAITHSGRGTHFGLALNLARFFSKKYVLAAQVEMKAWKGLWSTDFTQGFRDDFDAGFENNLSDEKDAARAQALKDGVDGSKQFFTRGSYYSSIGILISPFPRDYGGIALLIRKPSFSMPFHGTFGSIFNPNGADWTDIGPRSRFGLELSFKPLLFFKKYVNRRAVGLISWAIFYEEYDWRHASFDGLALSQFMKADFLNKYAIQRHFGFTCRLDLGELRYLMDLD